MSITKVDLDSSCMGDLLETPGAADKNKSQASLREHVSKADRWETLSRPTGSGKIRTVIPQTLTEPSVLVTKALVDGQQRLYDTSLIM